MTFTDFSVLAALPVLGLLAAGPASAAAAVPGSSSYAVSASFTSGGTVTGLAPVAAAQGALPGTLQPSGFDVSADVAAINSTTGIAHGKKQFATLTVTGTTLHSHASSPGFGVDNLSLQADGLISSITLNLQLYPPPGAGPLPQPLLTITAVSVTSGANGSFVVPMADMVSANGGFGSLSISGSLVGGTAPLTFSGAANANTELFSSHGVTITLNRNLISGLISCTPKCLFSPYGITADALVVDLNKVKVGGKRLSGQIVVGDSAVTLH